MEPDLQDRHAVPPELAGLAIDGGDLPLGGGLLALLRPALHRLEPGARLVLVSSVPSLRDDLPAWCRIERHEYLDRMTAADGRDQHRVACGSWNRPLAGTPAASFPAHGDPASGFTPRGASVEPGGPAYPFTLIERDRVAPPEVRTLYDQAVRSQWDAARDIAWDKVEPLPPVLERSVGQIMTFLAENEFSALWVPARFLPRIHPYYAEVAMFLATQLTDEARHIDVFLRRARAGGGELGISSVATSRSLRTLLEVEDFTESSFLLSVLGEGTFLDLLRFIEEHAPDEPTADLARRARNDEARHVAFGVAHVRHALASDPALFARLEAAVRRRAATLHDLGGVPAPLQDALTILAARGDDPRSVARGHEAFRALVAEMHTNRVRRLENAGFTREQSDTLSSLHTANFM